MALALNVSGYVINYDTASEQQACFNYSYGWSMARMVKDMDCV